MLIAKTGTIYSNKTLAYLLPCLFSYRPMITNELFSKNLSLLACGISDNKHQHYDNCIYMVYDVNGGIKKGGYLNKFKGREDFQESLKFIRDTECYVDDYHFDNIISGHKHCIVIKIPKEFRNIIPLFKEGKYSEMFNIKQLKYIDSLSYVFGVITRTNKQKEKFREMIFESFNVSLTDEDMENREYDYPPNMKNEIFNYDYEKNKIGTVNRAAKAPVI